MNKKEHAERNQWISEAAYFIADSRGFKPGKELDDWLVAEKKHAEKTIAYYFKVLNEEKEMVTTANLHKLADLLGIENAWRVQTKKELVHNIQKTSQHSVCFRTRKIELCEASNCNWQNECQKITAAWMR